MSDYRPHPTLAGRWVLADPSTYRPGERVAILGGLPATAGHPRATIEKVNTTTATVRTAAGEVHRIPLEELDPVGRRTGTNPPELAADLEPEGPLVVIPCGGAKAAHRAPAAELYVGSYFRAALRAALAITTPDRVRILSARHGLLELTDELEPYELKMGAPGSITADEVAAQATRELLDLAAEVHLLLPAAYAAVALEVWPYATDHLRGARGIGDHLAHFAELYRPAAELELEEPAPLAAGEWEPLTLPFAA